MKAGEVVLVQFPFTDLSKNKQRPALVLFVTPYSRAASLVTIAMITSKVDQPEIIGDLKLEDWQKSGLLHPSRLRLSKIVTVENEIIKKKLGLLSAQDQKKVSKSLKQLLENWI